MMANGKMVYESSYNEHILLCAAFGIKFIYDKIKDDIKIENNIYI
jgi:hypothetical protein